jgi:hypothetical protein
VIVKAMEWRSGRRCRALALAALVLALAGPGALAARAEEPAAAPSVQELQADVEKLRAEIESLKKASGSEALSARIAELERRLDLLAEELQKSRMGEAGAEEGEGREGGHHGFGPAASRVYGARHGVSLAGYGEMAFKKVSGDEGSGEKPGRVAEEQEEGGGTRIDLMRAVLYVGYKFTDKILFNSEIEFEHASTEAAGTVSVEFANVDFLFSERFGVRAGLLLLPLGFINQLHEPPIFHGVLRPDVEQFILPSTWGENGLGVFGEAGPLSYHLYAVAGLDAKGFSASEGIREGRQGGSESRATDFALTGRLDYTGTPGLLVGGSFFTGLSGQGQETPAGREVEGRVTLVDLHAQYEWRGLQLRGLYSHVNIDGADRIDELLGVTGKGSVGSGLFGAYVQAAYDVMTLHPAGRWSVSPFLRYEVLDTQSEVPRGYEADPANDRKVLTLGVGVKPIPNVILKADYQHRSNEEDTDANQFNLGLGYLF